MTDEKDLDTSDDALRVLYDQAAKADAIGQHGIDNIKPALVMWLVNNYHGERYAAQRHLEHYEVARSSADSAHRSLNARQDSISAAIEALLPHMDPSDLLSLLPAEHERDLKERFRCQIEADWQADAEQH